MSASRYASMLYAPSSHSWSAPSPSRRRRRAVPLAPTPGVLVSLFDALLIRASALSLSICTNHLRARAGDATSFLDDEGGRANRGWRVAVTKDEQEHSSRLAVEPRTSSWWCGRSNRPRRAAVSLAESSSRLCNSNGAAEGG